MTERRSVAAGTARDLARLGGEVRGSGTALALLALARRIDGDPEDKDLAVMTRELRLGLEALAARAPAVQEDSTVDELRRKREQRLTSEG